MILSFCTVCMNRLEHIKLTLAQNLENCLSSKKDVEYVLLDYSSQDGLGSWVKQHLGYYLKIGLLVYYRIEGKTLFDRSHSRNLAFKLAKGKFVCNVDADNFIGNGFSEYLKAIFNQSSDVFIVPGDTRDVLGRLSIAKEHFITFRGYDESMNGYGFEDTDFYKRLLDRNITKVTIVDKKYLKFIPHHNNYRFCNEYHGQNIKVILLRYLKPWETEVLYFYQNSEIHLVTLINLEIINAKKEVERAYVNPTISSGPERTTYSREDNSLLKGKFTRNKDDYELIMADEKRIYLQFQSNNLFEDVATHSLYHRVIDVNFFSSLVLKRSELDNRNLMESRTSTSSKEVNLNGFGMGAVRKNFSSEIVNIF